VEPAAVSWHALRLAETGPGTRVAVVGAGALGLLAVAGARRLGAAEVALEARHPYQKEAGERLGARVDPDGLYDVVVEAAGTQESLAKCGELVAPGGTIVVLGVHFGPVQLDWMPLFHKEARVIPSLGYCAHDGGRRWRTPPPCWPTTRHRPHPDHPPVFPSKMPPRRSGWRPRGRAGRSGW
jgi:threonine dehydrogenase-like Zn-dependent dehydrogenase